MSSKSLKGKWFRHFKGTFYMVVNEALSCEDRRPLVIYASREDPGTLWVRDRKEFLDVHPKAKVRRFEPVPFDADGPCEPITTIEFRQEAEVIAFQVFEGEFDVQFPPLFPYERGELQILLPNNRRCDFSLELHRATRSHMSSDFYDRPFELRYSDDEGRMYKLADCQAKCEGANRIIGTYNYDKSEVALRP